MKDGALEWACRRFAPTFPARELYERVTAGTHAHDDLLDAWVVGGAHLLARSRQCNGWRYVTKRGAWIDQAARDALASVLGEDVPSARDRATEYGITHPAWLRIYTPMRDMIAIGLANLAKTITSAPGAVTVAVGKEPLDFSHLWYGPQVGNTWAPPRGSGD